MSNTSKNIELGKSLQSIKKFNIPLTLNLPTLFYQCANERNWQANFISSSCFEIFGYTQQQFLSHEINFGQLINEEDKEIVWKTVQHSLQQHIRFELLYQMTTATNDNKIIYEQGEGVFDSHNQLLSITGFLSDVTQLCGVDERHYLSALENCANEINQILVGPKKNSTLQLPILSRREVQTLLHLCQGKSMKEIGIVMAISPRTVEMNIRHAKCKLRCRTTSELRKLFYLTDSGRKLLLEHI